MSTAGWSILSLTFFLITNNTNFAEERETI